MNLFSKHILFFSILITTALFIQRINGQIINIPQDYPTIQQGIDNASSGDTILVQPGTYTENINYNGKNIVIGSLFLTTQDTSFISQTIIDGNQNGSVVTFNNGEDSNAILTGFTITNGLASNGGGITCGCNSCPTIDNCTIIGNSANYDGGGICCEESSPTITGCTVNDNSVTSTDAGSGGGIKCYDNSSPNITECIINNNNSAMYGGGITCYLNSSPTITNCSITNNEANDLGGGIRINDNSSPLITNCFIDGNSSLTDGGGIHCENSSNPHITDCTISNNQANIHGGGVRCDSSAPILSNCTINGNEVRYSGGGISCELSSPTVMNCEINNNTVTEEFDGGSGGGIRCYDNSSPTITECIINNNNSAQYGGGITCSLNSSPTITNCSITNNEANDIGGGIRINENSSPLITNCFIDGNSSLTDGGGIHCENSSNPDIIDCTISNNQVDNFGGGVRCDSSSPILSNCTINNNTVINRGGGISIGNSSSPVISECFINGNSATGGSINSMGGGIDCGSSSSLEINDCTINENIADYIGGGMYFTNTSSITVSYCTINNNNADYGGGVNFNGCTTPSYLSNCIINNNTATYNGGGIVCYGFSSPEITNCVITNNIANECGGGIRINESSSPSITNCTLSDNIATTADGGGINCIVSSSANIANTILWADFSGGNGNEIYKDGTSSIDITYSDIEEGWTGEGNIYADPLFVDPDNGDYHLSWTNYPIPDSTKSPCIDTGNPDPQYSDPDGTRNDMGAYYYDQSFDPCSGISSFEYGGQIYNTIAIGNQCWMKENMNIGTRINGIQNQTDNSIIEKYCYDDDELNCNEYGGLYQWDEMMQYITDTATQGICPSGWHIPTDFKWKILEGNVDSQYGVGNPEWDGTDWRGYDAGLNLKSTSGWTSGGNGTDLYGFTVLPGGRRHYDGGYFYGIGEQANFWSSTEYDASHSWRRYLHYNNDKISRFESDKENGRSIRCLKDTVTVTYIIQTFSNPPQGGITSGSGTYNLNDEVTVTASANTGWDFVNWTENSSVVSTDYSYTFIITANRNLTANFVQQQFNISLSSNPIEGGNTTGGGIYTYGIEATVSASPNINWYFISWTEDDVIVSLDQNYSFTVTNDRILVANFSQDQLFSVLTNANPPQGGITTGDGTYNLNDEVTVTASANTGWEFINWTENSVVVSTDFNYTFNITTNHNLTANFIQQQFNISLTPNPVDGGSVSGQGLYLYGIEATVTASPNLDWSFINWTENSVIVSVDHEYSFIVTGDRNLTANFSQDILYSVITTPEPEEGGVTTGDGTYDEFASVIVNAIANNDWKFENWTEDQQIVSTESEYEFTITGNRLLTANFTVLEPLSLTVLASGTDICSEDTVFLDADVSGGYESYTYSWYSIPAGFTNTTKQTFDTPENNIWYVLLVQDYIDQIKDSIQITVNPKPPAHIIPKGNPTYVLICPDSGYIYQWIHNGVDIIGSTNQFYYPGEAGLSSGDYSVIVTNELGCSSQSSIFSFANKSLLIYPNPNDGSFTVILSYLEKEYPLNFILVNVFGNIVLNESISDAPSSQKLEYKISGLESGIYIIHIISNNKSVVSKKIVVL